jgi:hypothetical protein
VVPKSLEEDIVGELESKCVVRPVSCCVVLLLLSCPLLSPAAGGFVSLLLAKERANHMYAALFSYVGKHGALCCRVGGRPGDPCGDPAIRAHLVPEQWRPRG